MAVQLKSAGLNRCQLYSAFCKIDLMSYHDNALAAFYRALGVDSDFCELTRDSLVSTCHRFLYIKGEEQKMCMVLALASYSVAICRRELLKCSLELNSRSRKQFSTCF